MQYPDTANKLPSTTQTARILNYLNDLDAVLSEVQGRTMTLCGSMPRPDTEKVEPVPNGDLERFYFGLQSLLVKTNFINDVLKTATE